MCKSDVFLFSDNNEKITNIYRHNSVMAGEKLRSETDNDQISTICYIFATIFAKCHATWKSRRRRE